MDVEFVMQDEPRLRASIDVTGNFFFWVHGLILLVNACGWSSDIKYHCVTLCDAEFAASRPCVVNMQTKRPFSS